MRALLLLLVLAQLQGGGRFESAGLTASLSPAALETWVGNEPSRSGSAKNVLLVIWRGERGVLPSGMQGQEWQTVGGGIQLTKNKRMLEFSFRPDTGTATVAGQQFNVTQTNVILVDVDATSTRVVEAFYKDPAMITWGIEALHLYVRQDPKLRTFAGLPAS